MSRNAVASNLLMIVFLVGGAMIGRIIKQEVFPEFDLDIVSVSVAYPGASPEEVESGVVLAIEEQVRGIDGVKEVTATAREGMASVQVELELGQNHNRVLQDIKNGVDRITTFPEDAEEPQVQLLSTRREVMNVVLFGDQSEKAMRALAEQVREDFLKHPAITQVDLDGVRDPEITLFVPQAKLREHNLTLGGIADIVSATARDLPGGAVDTPGGEVLLRLNERRDRGREFEEIELIAGGDGQRVRAGDVAQVVDGFADTDRAAFFNGKRAVMVKVYRLGDQTPVEVATAVREETQRLGERLPPGVKAAILYDRAEIFEQRFDLLIRNGIVGLVLVMVLLGLFLEIRLAFWVMMGIPISFLGALILLPGLEVSINMISMFAFIMALGIVVDDAIVVGENVFELRQEGFSFEDASIGGAQMVAVPVTFSILTNIAAFCPLLFVTGFAGKIFRVIPLVVISVFLISLVEALFVLPAHLAHQTPADQAHPGMIERGRRMMGAMLRAFVRRIYAPFLEVALRYRYVTLAIGVAVLLMTMGLFAGGRVRTVFFPTVASDRVAASAALPFGAPVAQTAAVMRRLEEAAREVIAESGGDAILEGVFSQLAAAPVGGGGPGGGAGSTAGSHTTNVTLYLVSSEKREVGAKEIAQRWRERVGQIPGLESLSFDAEMGGPSGGAPVAFQLSHTSIEVLETAAADLAAQLATFDKTSDIDDGFSPGKPQLDFSIRPEARAEGLTATAIGRQMRDAFYGAEAIRQQRGRDELRVRVRLPEAERASELDVENFMIRAPSGVEMPFREAVKIDRGRAYTSIRRVDGRRVVEVSADVTPRSEADPILQELRETRLPQLLARYPGLGSQAAGSRRELAESMASLSVGFVFALMMIYAMLAVPFKSYVQPLIIMVSIPFGIVGAVTGHLLMGYNISIISMFGIVALSGVVVNDSLVLIDYANQLRRQGQDAETAIRQAGARRFRPIMLTSLTTFGGLAPMIWETSIQARFLVPMAISLGYGILFATVIALVLVPSLYLILEDAIRFVTGREIVETDAAPAREA